MKMTKKLILAALALLINTSLLPMAGEEAYYDPDLDDFTMIEVTKEPAKKAADHAKEAKKLILKAQDNLKAIKEVAESDELEQTIETTKGILNALRRLAFKTGPGFELANKSKQTIWVSIVSNGRIKTNQRTFRCDKILPGERFTLDLKNFKEDMLFGIYLTNPLIVSFTKANSFKPSPDFLYETTEGAQGKTKYLTWNPAKHNKATQYLYPQTGKLAGLAQGTRSGYSLKNNIKSFQINLLSMKEDEEEIEEVDLYEESE